METPKYKLSDLNELIALGDPSRIWFPVETKSVRAVTAYFGLIKTQWIEPDAAVDFILKGLCSLAAEDFVHRRILYDDVTCVADVYVKLIDGAPWYIKFLLEDEVDESGEKITCLQEVSFHPPREAIVTAFGKKISEGVIIYEEMRKMWVKRT